MRNLFGTLLALFSLSCLAQSESEKELIKKTCGSEYSAYQTAYLPFSSWCRVQVESGNYQNDADSKAHGYLTYNHDRPKAAFAFKNCMKKTIKE